MCGIAGFIGARREDGAALVERMLARLVHRGPDAGACRAADGWAIGARRLAILDLETGDQPVGDESGAVHAVLNGEIYNYRELRSELLASGHVLRSTGDTEVLVHLWEEVGPELVHRLRGMFALAIVDEARRTLFLARDRVGKKPLYWSRAGGRLCFASELKALREALPAPAGLDRGAIAAFLGCGFVPEGQCILTGVEKLPPAHTLTVDLTSGAVERRRYWRLDLVPDTAIDLGSAAEELREVLAESVRLRLRADVPLAIFLSGGLDSGLVARLAAAQVSGLSALSASFEGEASELPAARATAAACELEVIELQVDAAAGMALLPRLAEVYDEPLADSSAIPTLLLAQAARAHAKVVLTGDGGDEALAGYRRFLAARATGLPGVQRWGPPALAAVGVLARGARLAGWSERVARGLAAPEASYGAWGPVKLTSAEVGRLLGEEVQAPWAAAEPTAAPATRDPVNRMRALELEFFLPGDLLVKMDRATMAASLEARSPFLDHVLLERAARYPPSVLLAGGRTKAVTRRAARDLLPRRVRLAGKRGFEVPLERWLADGWRQEVRATLTDPAGRVRSLVDGDALASWADWPARRDRRRAARAVFTLLTLEHWLQRWA